MIILLTGKCTILTNVLHVELENNPLNCISGPTWKLGRVHVTIRHEPRIDHFPSDVTSCSLINQQCWIARISPECKFDHNSLLGKGGMSQRILSISHRECTI